MKSIIAGKYHPTVRYLPILIDIYNDLSLLGGHIHMFV